MLAGGSTDTIRNQSVFDCRRQSLKGLVDVDIRLGGAFPKGNTKFRGELLSFIRAHHFLVKHVALGPDQNLVDVHVGILLDLPNPVANAFETAPVRNVVYQQNALGAAEIRRGNRLCFIKLNTKDYEYRTLHQIKKSAAQDSHGIALAPPCPKSAALCVTVDHT